MGLLSEALVAVKKALGSKKYTSTATASNDKEELSTVERLGHGKIQSMLYSRLFSENLSAESKIKKWRQIAQTPEGIDALDEIAGEAIVVDSDEIIKLDLEKTTFSDTIKDEVRKSFEKVLKLLSFKKNAETLFKKFYIDADLIGELVYDKDKEEDGLKKIRILSPVGFEKLYLEDDDDFYYYWYKDAVDLTSFDLKDIRDEKKIANVKNVFLPYQITRANSGVWDEDKKMYISHIDAAMKVLNQLNTIEDAYVIAILVRAPERRVYEVDVSDIPDNQVDTYINKIMMDNQQKKVYDFENGSLIDQKKTISLNESIYVPKRADGKGISITTLPSMNMETGGIDVLNYFADKAWKALKIARNRRSKEANIKYGDETEIEREEIKFFKFVTKLRNQFNEFFLTAVKFDLLKRKMIQEIEWEDNYEKIMIIYTNNNDYAEIRKTASISKRIALLKDIAEYVQENNEQNDHYYFSHKWVNKNILKFTDEEVKEIDSEMTTGKTPPPEPPVEETPPEAPTEETPPEPPAEETPTEPAEKKAKNKVKKEEPPVEPTVETPDVIVQSVIIKPEKEVIREFVAKNRHMLDEGDVVIININSGDKKYIYEKGLLREVL